MKPFWASWLFEQYFAISLKNYYIRSRSTLNTASADALTGMGFLPYRGAHKKKIKSPQDDSTVPRSPLTSGIQFGAYAKTGRDVIFRGGLNQSSGRVILMSNATQEMSSKFHPLPCMFTIASLFCGFYSIVAAIKGDFTVAAYAILIAAIFDGLDGRIARLTGTTSTFGMELDSLCDLVSFGVAPGLLAYLWALQPFRRYGWLAGILYVSTTALRLARFNCQHTGTSKHFVGLPCPAAAAIDLGDRSLQPTPWL